jgi:hypothetical protein
MRSADPSLAETVALLKFYRASLATLERQVDAEHGDDFDNRFRAELVPGASVRGGPNRRRLESEVDLRPRQWTPEMRARPQAHCAGRLPTSAPIPARRTY